MTTKKVRTRQATYRFASVNVNDEFD